MLRGKRRIFTLLCKRCVIKKQKVHRDAINTTKPETIVKLCSRCADRIERRNKLAQEHEGLVRTFVRRFLKGNCKAYKLYPFEDAYDDGYEGLLRACELFDEDAGCKFSTYAFFWIRQAVGRAWKARNELIRVPDDKFGKVCIKSKQVDEEIFEHICVAPDNDDLHKNEIRDRVHQALGKIHRREADIIRMRMTGVTLGEVGDALGITRERARQLESRAKAKLKSLLEGSEKLLCES